MVSSEDVWVGTLEVHKYKDAREYFGREKTRVHKDSREWGESDSMRWRHKRQIMISNISIRDRAAVATRSGSVRFGSSFGNST